MYNEYEITHPDGDVPKPLAKETNPQGVGGGYEPGGQDRPPLDYINQSFC